MWAASDIWRRTEYSLPTTPAMFVGAYRIRYAAETRYAESSRSNRRSYSRYFIRWVRQSSARKRS